MTKFAPLLALALVFGCGDDDSRPDIMLMDTGPGADTGGGGVDSGPGMVDSGPGMDTGGGGGMCADPLPLLPGEALPRCDASTLTCLMGCADGACQQACIEADMTPPVDIGGANLDCIGCLNLQTFACGSMMGCGTQWGDWNCCLEACTDPNPDNCFAMCMTQQDAFFGCLDGLGTACQSALLSCFP